MALLLCTGFAPWGGRTVNPSWEMLEGQTWEVPAGWEVRTRRLPVVWREAVEAIGADLAEGPAAVVCFGLSEKARAITWERWARNRCEARAADESGRLPGGSVIMAEGPERYPSTLPLERLGRALQAAGLPEVESEDAGGFLCNYLFYRVRHLLETTLPSTAAGFVHVPPLADAGPSGEGWAREDLRRAARLIVREVAQDLAEGRSASPPSRAEVRA